MGRSSVKPGVGMALGQPGLPLTEMLDIARAADKAGARMLGIGDGFVEVFSVLGALATQTTSAQLVAGIATWTRTPVTTAVGISALQDLSGGRFTFGLGSMPKNWSEDWHDVDFSKPLVRMRDYIAAIRAAYEAPYGGVTSYAGNYYKFTDYFRLSPPTGFGLPILIAATGPHMTTLAGEIADGVLINTICSPEWFEKKSNDALIEGIKKAGRDDSTVERAAMVYCSIDEDERRAIDMAKSGLAFYFRTPYFPEILSWHGFDKERAAGLAALEKNDDAGMLAAVSDEMVRTFCLAGTREQVLERLPIYARNYDWIELSSPVGSDKADTIRILGKIVDSIPAMNEVFERVHAESSK